MQDNADRLGSSSTQFDAPLILVASDGAGFLPAAMYGSNKTL